MTGALMTGFVAKETVISSIVVSYNLDEAAAGDAEDGGDDLGSLPDLVQDSSDRLAGMLSSRGASVLDFRAHVHSVSGYSCRAGAPNGGRLNCRGSRRAVGCRLASCGWLLPNRKPLPVRSAL